MSKISLDTVRRRRDRGLSQVRYASSLHDLSTAIRALGRDNVVGMAGMVAFFAFLALIPLLLLLLAFVGDLLGGMVSATEVQKLFHDAVPGLSQQQFLQTYWEPVRHSKVTTRVLGVISLLVGTTGLHDSIDWAVNRIWKSERKRPFWLRKLRGLAVVLWVIAFAISSLWLTWIWALVLGAIHAPGLIITGILSLIPTLILDTTIFALLYRFTPAQWVHFRSAFSAALVAALLWDMSKIGFGWWVVEVGTYNRVYGPLAASVVVMLWLWISAIIFLFGAEYAMVLEQRRLEGV